jgi:hypothetical protein
MSAVRWAADRRRSAKTVKPGHGDQGDSHRTTTKATKIDVREARFSMVFRWRAVFVAVCGVEWCCGIFQVGPESRAAPVATSRLPLRQRGRPAKCANRCVCHIRRQRGQGKSVLRGEGSSRHATHPPSLSPPSSSSTDGSATKNFNKTGCGCGPDRASRECDATGAC